MVLKQLVLKLYTEFLIIANMYKTAKYKAGYKYQLVRDSAFQTVITGFNIDTKFIRLRPNGILWTKNGYAWDGASGPAIDTKTIMRGSLLHDAICQLINEGYLDNDKYWNIGIKEMMKVCKEDGMFLARRWWVSKALKIYGKIKGSNLYPSKIYTAP